ncbi:MAG: NUDIX hydrolase [Meiothermus sp.]|uniref:NUDIX hydrolase n=1 Tax=Meiothermus sp. TaxID=1955249 RepID=UPI0025FE47E2|nr:NUDIX hydrolase [Meiothermus sp.]MCS7069683.1 NUDIX hydrolase [Meiothermus sp.]MDW8426734.1 NUDIX hydrolase [Meiothermus sp.]
MAGGNGPQALPKSRRRVTSAGGVVLRERAGGKGLEVLLIAIKDGRVWSLPKGQVEPGERYFQTALREVREETGIEARVLAPLGSIRYHFTVRDDGIQTTVTKEVHHFLMGYVGGVPRPQKEEVDGVDWFPVSEALRRLSHQNERDAVLRALAYWDSKAPVGTHS